MPLTECQSQCRCRGRRGAVAAASAVHWRCRAGPGPGPGQPLTASAGTVGGDAGGTVVRLVTRSLHWQLRLSCQCLRLGGGASESL